MSQLQALFAGTELSEDFKSKAEVIFATAIEEQVAASKVELETKLQLEFTEKTEARLVELEEAKDTYIKEELIPHVDRYLSAVAQEWIKENEVVIASSLKVELAESFLTGLTGLAADHKMTLPEGKDQMVELQTKLDAVTEKANSLIASNVELQNENLEFKKSQVVATVTEKLSESQKEKFVGYSSKVEFKTTEQYTEALKGLVESYFPSVEVPEKPAVVEESKTTELTPQERFLKDLSEQARKTYSK